MGLMPAYYTTTNTRRRGKRKPQKVDLAHEKFLKRMGVSADELRKRDRPTPEPVIPEPIPEYSRNVGQLSNHIPGSSPKRESMRYTGERKLLGISAMHKSSLVPIWSGDEAKEIARMRRNTFE